MVKNKEKLATHHVVSGSIAEVQGNIDEAIRQFESALAADPQPSIYYILGRNYLKLNKLAKALKYSRRATELSPTDIEYKFLLARIYQNARVADSAAFVYREIIAMDSTSVQAYYNLGLLIEKDRPTEALAYYNKILDITGPEWQVLVKIADINERLGDVDETIKTVEELSELNPASLDLQKILVESYIKSDKLEKALELVDEALLIFPDDLNLIEYKASIHIKNSDWRSGAKEYLKIIKSKDINHDAKLAIGAAFLTEAGKDSSILPIAKEVFTEIAQDTSDWQTNVYLGEIALLEGNDSTALNYFDLASKEAEWNPRIWIRYGGLLFDRGNIDTAIVKMSTAVKNFPDEFVINLVLGLAHSQKNHHEEAKIYLKKSVELNPGDLTSLSALGFTLNQLGENEEAITYLNRALSIDEENIQILGMLGLIYDNEKMFDECDVSYSKALELDSTNAFVLNNYAYSLAERDIKLDEALKMSEAAVEADSENSSYLDTIGWIHYKLGNYKSAKEFIEKAVLVDSENAVQLDHLGDVYFKLGDIDNAKKYWTEAFEIDPTIENLKQKIESGGM